MDYQHLLEYPKHGPGGHGWAPTHPPAYQEIDERILELHEVPGRGTHDFQGDEWRMPWHHP